MSLNITVTNTLGPGFIKIYPEGASAPVVSTLNYAAGQTVANAAVVPLGTAGGVTVAAGVSGTDLIIDVNGYYGASGTGAFNTFVGQSAGNSTMTGDFNAALGTQALGSNTTGTNNTAVGAVALALNTLGVSNTAVGRDALYNNLVGAGALLVGSQNTAIGHDALHVNGGQLQHRGGL